MNKAGRILVFFGILIFSLMAFAMNGRTTYQAKIVKPDGQPLQATSVNFRFSVLDTVGSCVLYVEDYLAVNMNDSGGLISFALGNGTRSFPTSGTSQTFQNVFDNSVTSFSCQTPGIYSPGPTDVRKVVMQFNDGSGWQTLPAMTINAVPYAMYADKANDAKTLNGKTDTAFVENSTLAALNCNPATHALTFNGVSFGCIPVGSSSSGITSVTTSGTVLITGGTASAPVISIQAATVSQDGYLTSLDYAEFKAKLAASSTQIINTLGYAPVSAPAVATQISNSNLSGDVSGTVAANSVVSVGGKSAAQISTSVDDTLAATASATVDTIVKRNSSGNITVNDLYANAAKVNYVDIYKPSTSFNIRLQAPTSLSANYTLTLPNTAGVSGQVIATDGSGNLSWVNAATGSVTSVSANAPLVSTGGATPTISITQATSSTDGYLSSADWNTFNNKQQATSAAIIATLGYTPADNAVSGTYVQKANNLSDLASSATARTNLGLGTLATANSIDLGSASATGIIADARLANQSNVTSGTQYTKVTVDGKGRVTSGAQLSSSDVTTALGYTPANDSASGTYLVKASNLSDLTNIPQARSNLGLGGFATISSLDLGSASAIGTLDIARLPSFAGDATIAAASNTIILSNSGVTAGIYTKVTVDGKGRVTSGAQLSSSDVTNALGYTPATSTTLAASFVQKTGDTMTGMLNLPSNGLVVGSSQLVVSGAFVGIGTNNPSQILEVKATATDSAIRLSNTTGGSKVWDVTSGGNGNYTPGYFAIRNVTDSATPLIITPTGSLGVGLLAPTAKLHLVSGTSSANTAPLKFTSGTLTSTAESGAMEYDGFNFYLTDSNNTRRTIATGSSAGTIDNASYINSSSNITMTPGGGSVIVSATTASTNSSTGALVVKGGLGVAGNINSGGTIQGVSVTATSGMISPYIVGSVNASGNLTLDSTTHATKGNIFLAPNGGNVGIGTSVPNVSLQVSGTGIIVDSGTTASYGSGIKFMNTTYKHYTVGVKGSQFVIADTSVTGTQTWTGTPVERLVIDSTGNVGIGTASPTHPLQVYAAGTSSLLLSTGADDSRLYLTDTNRSIRGIAGGALAVHTGGSERVRIDSAGNIGVGTTNPQAKFGIVGARQNTITPSNAIFKFGGDDVFLYGGAHNGVGGPNYPIMLQAMRDSDSFAFPIVLNPNGGNVGIGTTTPAAPLSVSGMIRSDSAAANFSFIGNAGGSNLQIYHPAAGAARVFNSGGDIALQVDSGGTATGNVGIGTTSPETTLQVSKNISSQTNINNDPLAWNRNSQFKISSGNNALSMSVIGTFNERLGIIQAGHNGDGTGNYANQTDPKLALQPYGGNVGIGTTTPDKNLTIHSTGLDNYIHLTSSMTGTTLSDGVMIGTGTAGDAAFYNRESTNMIFLTSNTERVRIDPAGKVGIGTTAPSQALDVNGYVQSYSDFYDVKTFADGWVVGDYAEVVQAAPAGAAGNSNIIRVSMATTRGNWVESSTYDLVSAHSESDVWREIPATSVNYYTTFTYRCFTVDANGFGGVVKFRIRAIQNSTNCSASSTGALPIYFKAQVFGHNSGWTKLTSTGTGATVTGYRSSVGSEWNLYTGASRNAGLPTITAKEGNVGIGTNTPSQALHIAGDRKAIFGPNSNWGANLIVGGNGWVGPDATVVATDGNLHLESRSGGYSTYVNWYAATGGLRVGNGTGGGYGPVLASAFTVSSDERLKKDIKILESASDKVSQIRGVSYKYRDKKFNQELQIGVIAQEVQKVYPEAVLKDEKGFLSVNYAILVAPLIQAFKELKLQVEEFIKGANQQSREIASLKQENAQLKREMEEQKRKNDEIKAYLCEQNPQGSICSQN